jgi:tetratricopeptide (TPR) repeat protein
MRRIAFLAIGLAVAIALPLAANAAKKNYRYEDDPIRLGLKALEEGRIDDARNYFNEAITNEHQIYRAHYGLGELLSVQADYANAEPLYRQAIAEKDKETGSPDFPEAHTGLGFVLMRLQRYAEAKQEFEQALKEKGNLWEAQYGLARVAIQDGKYDDALQLLEKGSKKKGMKEREDLYRYGMAAVQFAKNDLLTAEKNALSAFTINPSDPDYGTLVAEIYTKRGAPTLAIDAYERALATPGLMVTAPVHHRLGVLYQGEARYNDALEQYKNAVRMDSTYAPAVKDMAALYALANRNEEAATAYLAYSRLRPDDSAGFAGFAEACLKTKRNKQALEAAQQAFKIDSTNVAVRVVLARASFVNRDRARAGRLYSTIVDSTKFEPEDFVRIGQIELDRKEYDAAEKNLLRALKMDSTQADAYFSLGLIDLGRAQPDSAVLHFDRSTQLAPTNAGAWLNKGIALQQLKKQAEAVGALREAVRLAPDYTPGRAFLAQALVQADSLGAAVSEYKIVREKDPKNAMALRGLGFCYLKRREYGQAAAVLKEATEADPNNADGWAMLGQAQALQNQVDIAVESLQKALAINPSHVSAKSALDALQGAKKKPAGK